MLHMAARGWVCVAINYRLSPRNPFPAQIEDVKTGDRVDPREHRRVRRGPRLRGDHRRLGRRAPRRAGGADPERPGVPARLRGRRHDASRRRCRSTASTTSPEPPVPGGAQQMRDRFLAPRVLVQGSRAAPRQDFERRLPAAAGQRRRAAVLRDPRRPRRPGRRGARRARSSRPCARCPSSRSPTPSFPGAQHAFDVFPSVRSRPRHPRRGPVPALAPYDRGGRGRPRPQPRGRPRIRSAATLRSTCVVPPAMLRHRVQQRLVPGGLGLGPTGESLRAEERRGPARRTPDAGAPRRASARSTPRRAPAGDRAQRRPQRSSALTVAASRHRRSEPQPRAAHRAPRASARAPARRWCRATGRPWRPARWPAWCGPAASRRRPRRPRTRRARRRSSRKTSLNTASPVSSRSGRTSMPGARHVDEEVGDALVLRGVRVRCGPGRSPSRPAWASEVHTFWPVSRQPPSTRVARVRKRGQVGAGARLAEQLAPDEVAAQRRGARSAPAAPRCRARGSSVPPRRRSPGPGRSTPAAASSSSMTSCSTGPRPARTAAASAVPAARRRRALHGAASCSGSAAIALPRLGTDSPELLAIAAEVELGVRRRTRRARVGEAGAGTCRCHRAAAAATSARRR